MTHAFEVNFDGLIGPTHNYGGMSEGNIASAINEGDVSKPKEAALQGLEKMRFLLRSGLKQGFLPPLKRPSFNLLRACGFGGTPKELVASAIEQEPRIARAAFSASSMWAANAATVSPSADTSDGRLHLTAANLSTMLHRSQEGPETYRLLRSVFADERAFCVHEPLPMHPDFSDEGAANHVRFAADHGAQGVELLVYGRENSEDQSDRKFPARQTGLASRRIAASHGLRDDRTVFARQSKQAIDAGAFHNDVVCVGTLDTLFTHELAFEHRDEVYSALRQASTGFFGLNIVEVAEADVPIGDAITSYLFNSQLLKLPEEDRLVLLAPMETQETESTRRYCEKLASSNGPIGRVEFIDVRQSMRNGGGPACLRLRVVMSEQELKAVNQAYLLTEEKIDKLSEWVDGNYRDQLAVNDLADSALLEELETAHEKLSQLIISWS